MALAYLLQGRFLGRGKMFPENADFALSLGMHDHCLLKELGTFFLPGKKTNVSELSFATSLGLLK